MSYPNQRIIKLKPTSVKNAKGRQFLGIFNDIWCNALKDLTATYFILYLYLASRNPRDPLELSQVAVKNETGMAKSTYYKAVNILVEKGYLVETSSNHYEFYDTPHVSERNNNIPRAKLKTLSCEQSSTHEKGEVNNINNKYTSTNIRDIVSTSGNNISLEGTPEAINIDSFFGEW